MKTLKKIFIMTLCITLSAALTLSTGAFADTADTGSSWGDVQQDNFTRTTSADAWNKGDPENVEVITDVGDGAIRLTEGKTDGSWTSPEMDVPDFEYMVASWTADTPEGTWVEIKARAYVTMYKEWTDWQSWGQWGTSIKRGSANTETDRAMVDTDTFIVLGEDGETASRIQLMAVLHSEDPAVTPTLRDISTTSLNTLDGQDIPVYHPDEDVELPEKVILDTPSYSQLRRDISINGGICSSTSMTMLLNDRDSSLDLFPEEIALRSYDFIYKGFGNWPFSTAAAGAYGYSAYVHYADFDFLRQELACGRSLAISVQYANSESGGNPYLENGAASDTGGHLITIVGYETIDGVDYFYSNDSATSPDAECALRRYRADQLDVCWSSRIVYVVSDQTERNAGQDAPQRIQGTLEPAEAEDTYRLMVNGEEVALSSTFSAKTSNLGGGTVFVITDNAQVETMPEPVEATTANSQLEYCKVDTDGHVVISTADMQELGVKGGTCYIITNNGPTYVAAFTLGPPAASGTTTIIIAVAVIAVILLAGGIMLQKKKQNRNSK